MRNLPLHSARPHHRVRRGAAGGPAFDRANREYRGLYHVLGGGALSPIDGVDPGSLRIDELLDRVERNGIEEVGARDQPDDDGRGDRSFLADRLRSKARVTRLASGLPVVFDLEYADEATLGTRSRLRRDTSARLASSPGASSLTMALDASPRMSRSPINRSFGR